MNTSIAAAAMFWGDFISLCHFGKGEGEGEGEGIEDHQGVGLVWDWAEVLAGDHNFMFCGDFFSLTGQKCSQVYTKAQSTRAK